MNLADPDDPVALLQAMVAIDSVNASISGKPDAEAALVDFLARLTASWGWVVHRLPVPGRGCNLLLHPPVLTDGAWLLFDSHLDTVGVAGMDAPFRADMEGGKIHGRGACDTKGSGAAMLWALKNYAARSTRRNNAALIFSSDEEIGKTGVRHFVRHDLARVGLSFSGVIVGEPTCLRPVVAHNGYVRWRIETRGRAAHSSDPGKGISAIRSMCHVIEVLERDYIARLSAHDPLTGAARCSINVIQGGSQVNIIPDRCWIEIDRRLIPGERPEAVLAEVENILVGLRTDAPDLSVVQLVPHSDPPLAPQLESPFLSRVAATLARRGFSSAFQGAPYTTNASTYTEAGLPSVVIGPGDIAQAHQAGEFIDLEEFHRAIFLYEEIMALAGA